MKFELEGLKELISHLYNSQLRNTNEHRIYENISGRSKMLLDRIIENDYGSEGELKSEICAGQNQSARFRYVKNELGRKLLDTIITANPERGNNTIKVYEECYKSYASIKVLIARGVKKTAIQLALETLKVARRYEITEIVYLLSFEIAQYYAIITDSRKKTYYQKIYFKYFKIFEAEQHALIHFSDLTILLASSKKLQPHQIAEAKKIVSEIQFNHRELRSYKLNFLRYISLVMQYQIEFDYENLIDTSVRAIKYLDGLKFTAARSYYFNFFYQMIPALLSQKEYVRLKEVFKRCIEMSRIGAFNWNVTLLYQSIFGCQSENYALALSTYQKIMKYKDRIPANVLEYWKIIEAYFFLLDGLGEFKCSIPSFRLYKFLNEVPEYAKDKAGANVTILTLQILLLLLRNKRGKIIDRMDALKMYTYKYLVRDNTYRSQCFIKIILQLERSRFHPIAFKRHTAPLLKKMQQMPLRFTDLEVEIIPYERQYEFILQLLER